ncbi:MAG: T9SS type A sorting domain-containing protein [Bacteroidota bacterium]
MKKIKVLLFLLIGMINISNGNNWLQKADFGGHHRIGTGGFSIGSKGYVGAGFYMYPTVMLNDFWSYDTATNAWTQVADYPDIAGFDSEVSFSIDGFGYMGLYGNTNFYQYDPINNIWSAKANYPGSNIADQGKTGFSIGKKGYVGLGGDFGIAEVAKDFWEYDPATDSWTRKADFGGASRYYAYGFSINGNGYVGSGDSIWLDSIANFNELPLNDYWQYDTAMDSWTYKGLFLYGSQTNFVIGDKAYICDMAINDTTIGDFWQYNSLTNIWSQLTGFQTPGYTMGYGFTIGNKGYVYTGDSATNRYWEYSPDSTNGITEINQEINISLAPNPFTSQTTLFINDRNNIMNRENSISIYNLLGQEMQHIFMGSNKQIVIHRNDLPGGMYFYKLMDDNKTVLGVGKMLME